MPDPIELLLRWWKQILALTITTAVIAAIIVFAKPKMFEATATALPATPVNDDRNRIFSENLQVLYPNIGTPDDLDMMVGTAKLDTIYFPLVASYNLIAHYKYDNDPEGEYKAVVKLKSRSRIYKSEYGELKVKVNDKDRNIAANLANGIISNLSGLYRRMQQKNNEIVLASLVNQLDSVNFKLFLSQADDSGTYLQNLYPRDGLLKQKTRLEELIGEFETLKRMNTEPIFITETAKPPLWPAHQHKIRYILLGALAGFLFGLLLAVVLEKRKNLQ